MWYSLAEVTSLRSRQVADRMPLEDRSDTLRLAREWDVAHPREP